MYGLGVEARLQKFKITDFFNNYEFPILRYIFSQPKFFHYTFIALYKKNKTNIALNFLFPLI